MEVSLPSSWGTIAVSTLMMATVQLGTIIEALG